MPRRPRLVLALPASVLERLHRETARPLAQAALRRRIEDPGLVPTVGPFVAARALIHAEIARACEPIASAGIPQQ